MLGLYRFRVTKDCDMAKNFIAYVNQTFGMVQGEHLQPFINELSGLREMIGYFQANESNLDNLEQNVKNCETYLNSLNRLSNYVKFEKCYCNINFKWKEFTTQKDNGNVNINYEICSVYYNLAITYFLIGKVRASFQDVDNLKTALKYFQYAAQVFKEIIEIASKKVLINKGNDLMESNLTCCFFYCLANAQETMYKFAEMKKLAIETRKKLARGVSDYYSKCYQSSTSSGIDKNALNAIRANSLYYKSIALKLQIEILKVEFDKYGKNVGLILGYSQQIRDYMDEAAKLMVKTKMEDNFYKLKAFGDDFYTKFNEQNNKIYRQEVIPLNKLPDIGTDIDKVKPIKYPVIEDFIQNIDLLDVLIPPELKEKVDMYKQRINEALNEIMNRMDITNVQSFLKMKNLPNVLSTGVCNTPISDQLYNSIQEIHNQGGMNLLSFKMTSIEKALTNTNEKLEAIRNKIFTSIEEDKKIFLSANGTKWQPPNYNEITSQQTKQSFECSRLTFAYNSQKNKIKENSQYYSLFSLPKQDLESRIPSSIEPALLAQLASVKTLKTLIDTLMKDGDILETAISKLFTYAQKNIPLAELGDYNITLDEVVHNMKISITGKVNEVTELANKVKKEMEEIDQNYMQFIKDCAKIQNPSASPETQKFLQFLNNAKNEYVQDLALLETVGNDIESLERKAVNLHNEMLNVLALRNESKIQFGIRSESEFNYQMAHNRYNDIFSNP